MPIIIDCSHINNIDFTAAKGFKAMISDFDAREQRVMWLNPSDDIQYVLRSVAGDMFRVVTSVHDIDRGAGDGDDTSMIGHDSYQNQGAEIQT